MVAQAAPLMPHAGRWEKAGVPAVSASWQQTVVGALSSGGGRPTRSLIDPGESGAQASAAPPTLSAWTTLSPAEAAYARRYLGKETDHD